MASESIHFRVSAVPIAQPRARATTVNGTARMYEAKKSHAIHSFKASVRLAASAAYQGPPLSGPLKLTAIFVFPRPGRLNRKKDAACRLPCDAGRCDVDNLVKGVCDSLNQLTFVDDRQICRAEIEKHYAAKDEQPHVSVTIERL